MRDHNRQRSNKPSDEEASDPEDMIDLTSLKSPNMPVLLKPPQVPKKKKEKAPSKIKSEAIVTEVASPKKTGPKKTSPKKTPPPPKTAPPKTATPAVKSPKRAEKPAAKKEKKPVAKAKNTKAELWAELAVWAQKMSKAERGE